MKTLRAVNGEFFDDILGNCEMMSTDLFGAEKRLLNFQQTVKNEKKFFLLIL